ncbi:hypothetical protein DFR29_103126 [Tahibacter aquaticus]|uniref:Uncharacterized protein n=2 Tax=Tahibacter aquaticus TaxID=520092 RepID=A0A4R6Z4K6_9GAMM|nr:hypothetical protein DFR29_103126 [Tahibacter aquaticus]
MAHFVTGLIARRTALRAFANRYGLPAPVMLNEVLALLPLDEDMLDALLPAPAADFVAGFNMLSPGLMQALQAGSERSTLLYFETEYFGGMGTQGAVVFRDGELVFGPQSAELGPINNALALLGVRTVPPAVDEFETVGLQLHGSTDEWLASATED